MTAAVVEPPPMSWDLTAIVAAAGSVAAPLGIWGLALQVRAARRAEELEAQRAREREETVKQATYTKGLKDGRASMQPSIDLITYELAEAVRERAQCEQRCRDLDRRIQDLERELRFRRRT